MLTYILASATLFCGELETVDAEQLVFGRDNIGVKVATSSAARRTFHFISRPLDLQSMLGKQADIALLKKPQLQAIWQYEPSARIGPDGRLQPWGVNVVSGAWAYASESNITLATFYLRLSVPEYGGETDKVVMVHNESASLTVSSNVVQILRSLYTNAPSGQGANR